MAGEGKRPWPESRAGRARLLRRVFECDPLCGPRCGEEMRIVAFLTEPRAIDRILSHLGERPPERLLDARDPPAA